MEKELSKLEVLKASRNPLKVVENMFEEARGGEPLSDEHIGLLKWYGMYPHIDSDKTEDKKYFMKRIKLVDTTMNLEQLKVMAKIGNEYAQGLVALGGDDEELAKENIKVDVNGTGVITLSINNVDSDTDEFAGTFEAIQPSDTDMGSKDPLDVKIIGELYGRKA